MQAEGIIVAQVLLCSERQLLDILNSLNIIRTNVQFLHLVTIEWYMVINVRNYPAKSFALERAHLVATHAFFIRIPNHIILVMTL